MMTLNRLYKSALLKRVKPDKVTKFIELIIQGEYNTAILVEKTGLSKTYIHKYKRFIIERVLSYENLSLNAQNTRYRAYKRIKRIRGYINRNKIKNPLSPNIVQWLRKEEK